MNKYISTRIIMNLSGWTNPTLRTTLRSTLRAPRLRARALLRWRPCWAPCRAMARCRRLKICCSDGYRYSSAVIEWYLQSYIYICIYIYRYVYIYICNILKQYIICGGLVGTCSYQIWFFSCFGRRWTRIVRYLYGVFMIFELWMTMWVTYDYDETTVISWNLKCVVLTLLCRNVWLNYPSSVRKGLQFHMGLKRGQTHGIGLCGVFEDIPGVNYESWYDL